MSPNAALSKAYAKAPKGFSKHILRDLGTSAMPAMCHHTTPRDLPSSRSFLGHPAQISYVHRISCLSFAIHGFVHQTSNVDVWQLQS